MGNQYNQDEDQYSFVMCKPDCLEEELVGMIIDRLREEKFEIPLMKQVRSVTKAQIESHYSAHRGKDFFPGLVRAFENQTVYALIVKGNIDRLRKLAGNTDPSEAGLRTIRRITKTGKPDSLKLARLENRPPRNRFHCSGNVEEACQEIPGWFNCREIPIEVKEWILAELQKQRTICL